MRRSLLVLLALVLLAQFSWARAAAYCQHETSGTPAAAHWGHHEHAHPDLGQKKKGEGSSKLVADADCNVCHASCAHPLRAELDAAIGLGLSGALTPRALIPPASAPPGAPERPQWPALA